MRELFCRQELKRIIRKKAAKLLIFSNSYQFTMMCRKFHNSLILDKKIIASSKTLFAE